MKRALVILTAAGLLVTPLSAHASGHELIVDGVAYDSTKEAGDSIHWETPGSNPTSATFAERSQTWVPGDNGSEHLPCEFGVHWVSNENVLTISGCLDNPNTTTTTEVTTSSEPTTTSSTETSTTSPSTSSVSTTTVPETTSSTSSPTTSTASSTTLPASTVTSSTVSPGPAPNQPLPKTGSDHALLIVGIASLFVLGGVALARRPR